jgi:thermitase
MNMNRCWMMAALAVLASSALAITKDYVPGEVILKMKPGYTLGTATRNISAVPVYKEPTEGFARVKLPTGMSVTQAVNYFNSLSSVQYAEPNYIAHIFDTPTDPFFNLQYAPQVMNVTSAWNFGFGNPQVIVAVIDSGVDYKHEELLAPGKVILGHNYPGKSEDPMDDNGHGTHVAGIIGAPQNNGLGIAGIAGNVTILAIKTMDKDGVGTFADIASGIIEAANKGANVINLSLGGYGYSSALQNAVSYAINVKNVTVVAAAGNDSIDISVTPVFPASLPDVISVAASTSSDRRAFFSNYGPTTLVAAPGLDVLSTYWTSDNAVTGYQYDSGTSMASPNVAGVVALMLSRAGTDTPTSTVRTVLERSVKYVGGWVKRGRVDAYRAVRDIIPAKSSTIALNAIAARSGAGFVTTGALFDAQTASDGRAFGVAAKNYTGTGMLADVLMTFKPTGLDAGSLTSANVTFRASAIVGASAMYWVYNNSTGSWDLLNNFAISGGYTTVSLPLGGSTTDYRKYFDSTGACQVLVRSVLPSRLGYQSYNLKVDYATLTLSQPNLGP